MEAVKEPLTGEKFEAHDKGTLELLQEGISKTSREIWLAGLGIYSTVDEEGTRLFNKFVSKGRDLVEDGVKPMATNGKEPAPTYLSEKKDKMSHEIITRLDDATQFVQKKFFGGMEKAAPSRSEMKDLTEKVDKLTDSLAMLVRKMEDTGKSAPEEAAGARARARV